MGPVPSRMPMPAMSCGRRISVEMPQASALTLATSAARQRMTPGARGQGMCVLSLSSTEQAAVTHASEAAIKSWFVQMHVLFVNVLHSEAGMVFTIQFN